MRDTESSLQQFGEFLLKRQLVRRSAAPYFVRWVRQFPRAIVNRIEPVRRRTRVSRALERLLEGRETNLSGHRPLVRQWLATE